MRNATQSLRMSATRSGRKARRDAEGGVVRTEHLENRLLFSTYNALSDFTTAANPNGAWTYGESTNGTFAADAGVSGAAWTGVGTGNQSSIGTSPQATGLVLKPGQSGGSADVRWTAPADGTYSITGNFDDFTGNASDDVRVTVNNGSPVVSGSVGPAAGAGGQTSVPITQNAVVLKAGDNVDFVVGPGSDGWDTNDVVSLQATISTSSGTTGNTSSLQTTVTGRLPAKALVAGERVTPAFRQVVTLANTGTTTVTGPVTIEMVLGLTPAGEAGDPMITSISRRVNLRAGRSMRFPVLIKSMPTGANGDYFAVAQVTDPTGTSTGANGSGTITVKPAFVDLTGVAGTTPARAKAGRRILVPVIVTNSGNTQAKGPLDINVVATSTTATVNLGTVTKRIVLNPGRRVRLLLVETLPTSMPAATYTLNGAVDPNHAFNDPTITNNTFTASTPLVVS